MYRSNIYLYIYIIYKIQTKCLLTPSALLVHIDIVGEHCIVNELHLQVYYMNTMCVYNTYFEII